MSTRKETAERFTADWADIPTLAGIWVVATMREVKSFQQLTAIISQASIGPFPQAPLSHRTVGLVLELVSALPDLDEAADELDPIVDDVLTYLDTRYTHGAAQSFFYGELLAYRIPISVTAQKES